MIPRNKISRNRWVFLNRSGSKDPADPKNPKNIKNAKLSCLLFKTPKIIKIGSRSSEIRIVQTHRCTGGVPLIALQRTIVNFRSGLMYRRRTHTHQICEAPYKDLKLCLYSRRSGVQDLLSVASAVERGVGIVERGVGMPTPRSSFRQRKSMVDLG